MSQIVEEALPAHSPFGPSSAKGWMGCPGKINAERGLSDPDNDAAIEGSAAHELAEGALREHFEKNRDFEIYLKEMRNHKFTDWVLKNGKPVVVDGQMINGVRDYVEYCIEIAGDDYDEVIIEERVYYTDWVPNGFGTADFIVVKGSHVDVIDFKYGQGIRVKAHKNPQAMLYCLGVYQALNWLNNFETFAAHIVQPRNGGISVY